MKRLDVGGFDAEVYDAENGDYVFHDEVQPMLRTLAQAVLEAHELVNKRYAAVMCEEYASCDCEACVLAREVLK